jgi:hypothetical protein
MMFMNALQLGARKGTIRDLNKFLGQTEEPVSPLGSDSMRSKSGTIRNLRNATSTAIDADFDLGDEG